MAEDEGESLVPTVRTRATISMKKKKDAARIRQTGYSMAQDEGESSVAVPTMKTRATKSVEEKKEAARIRQNRYREKLKVDPQDCH